MPHLDRDGVRIYYEVHGEGEPLLLSHGYGATSMMWQRQVESLAECRSVVTWDMRGHGQSDSPDDPSRYSVIRSLPDIKVPTLVLVGAEDKPFHGASDYMATKIPGATKVAGAGHAASLDQLEAFDMAVIDFLAALAL